MKRISNSNVTELKRLIPVLIDSIPPEKRTLRVQNAIRLSKILLKRLNKLKDE